MVGKVKLLFLSGLSAASLCAAGDLVKETVFVAFDTETTGFSREQDRIVEIGAVKFLGNGEVLCATNWLVNPQRDIPYFVTQVHGIDNSAVADAPLFSNVWNEFSSFCGDAVLLAHNAPFDVGFVRAELERAGIKAPAMPVADTLPLFRRWFPREESHSLGKLTESLGVAGNTYHRAEADAFHIVNLFRLGMKERQDLTIRRFMHDAGGFVRLDGGRCP